MPRKQRFKPSRKPKPVEPTSDTVTNPPSAEPAREERPATMVPATGTNAVIEDAGNET